MGKKKPAAAGGRGDARGDAGSSGTVRLDRKMTAEEETAARRFISAVYEDALRYIAMTEEEVEEEYRLAGKLHKYDPDTEWMKRYARVARMYPPPSFMAADLGDHMMYLEEDEQDYAIGLPGCVGMLEQDDV